MVASYTLDPSRWVALVEAPEEVRQAEVCRFHEGVAGLPESDRIKTIAAMAEAEHRLPDEKLRWLVKSHLKAWLSIPGETASVTARCHEEAMKVLPGTVAMRRIASCQTVAREFDSGQVRRLAELLPGAVGGLPSAGTPVVLLMRRPTDEGERPQDEGGKPKNRGWRFWQKAA